jgi:hypothetical protein
MQAAHSHSFVQCAAVKNENTRRGARDSRAAPLPLSTPLACPPALTPLRLPPLDIYFVFSMNTLTPPTFDLSRESAARVWPHAGSQSSTPLPPVVSLCVARGALESGGTGRLKKMEKSPKRKSVPQASGVKEAWVPKGALRRGSTAPPSVNEPSSHSPRRSSPGTAAAYVVARNCVRGGLASVSQGSHLAHLIQLIITKTSFPARTFCKVAVRCRQWSSSADWSDDRLKQYKIS